MGSVYSKGQPSLSLDVKESNHSDKSSSSSSSSVSPNNVILRPKNGLVEKEDEMEFLSALLKENDIRIEKEEERRLHPMIAIGLTSAFVLNLGMILSLPPVLRGKGAPYLPTFSKKLSQMFEPLAKKQYRTFVDLGSGDGRVVFAAARQPHLFQDKCIGYEINPVLHGWANLRRFLQGYKYWSKTQFSMKDLWKVDLRNVDVVAVYGLQPIMKDLGVKLQNELRPGAVVISNVFAIPGWRSDPNLRHIHNDGLHYYTVPHCYQTSNPNKESTPISSSTSKV